MKSSTLFLGFFITLCFVSSSFASNIVTIRSHTDITGRSIKLSDVFNGIASDADVEVALAPEPGKSVTYDSRVLTKLAASHQLSWQPQSMADKVVLTRTATHITPEMISAAALKKLRENNKDIAASTDIVLDNRTLAIALPSDQSPDFELVHFSYDASNRRFQAELLAKSDSQPITRPVSGRVILKKSIPVLSRPLVAGTVVGPHDLNWIDVKEEQVGLDVLSQAEGIVGQELRHDQNEGSFLRARDLAPPRLVLRGGLVTLKVETPLMQITTQGRSLQDGAKGDIVRVSNLQSKRIIEGVVEADGLVRVNALQQRMASADHQKE